MSRELDIFKTKEETKLLRAIGYETLKQALANQQIDPRGKTEKQFRIEAFQYLKRIRKYLNESQLLLVVDFRNNILKEARRFRETEQAELSCILYSTWFEHWLNYIIIIISKRKKISEENLLQMLRETNFRSKLTWIPILLGIQPLNNKHIKTMLHVVELRNLYVHYKYQGKIEEDNSTLEKDLNSTISTIEKTIRYLNRYENKLIYQNQKSRIYKIMK